MVGWYLAGKGDEEKETKRKRNKEGDVISSEDTSSFCLKKKNPQCFKVCMYHVSFQS